MVRTVLCAWFECGASRRDLRSCVCVGGSLGFGRASQIASGSWQCCEAQCILHEEGYGERELQRPWGLAILENQPACVALWATKCQAML